MWTKRIVAVLLLLFAGQMDGQLMAIPAPEATPQQGTTESVGPKDEVPGNAHGNDPFDDPSDLQPEGRPERRDQDDINVSFDLHRSRSNSASLPDVYTRVFIDGSVAVGWVEDDGWFVLTVYDSIEAFEWGDEPTVFEGNDVDAFLGVMGTAPQPAEAGAPSENSDQDSH